MSLFKFLSFAPAAFGVLTLAAPTILETREIALNSVDKRQDASWKIKVEVGTQTFDIGDQDANHFRADYIESVCGDVGCDEGNAHTFDTVLAGSLGYTSGGSATISMEGNYANGDEKTTLLNAIVTSMFQSAKCNGVRSRRCINTPSPLNGHYSKRDLDTRESASTVLDCQTVSFGHCTLVNFIQATIYDGGDNQKAQMTFRGSSQSQDAFDCHVLADTLSGLFGLSEAPGVGALGGAFATAFCDGSSS